MSRHQKKRLTSYFPRRWLEEVLEQCRKMTGLVGSLLSNASYGSWSKGSWGPSPDQLEADTDTDVF